jgi:hypothetical protein
VDLLAPLFGMQQHPFDNAGLNVVGPQVLDRAHGIEGGLHDDAAFDDGTAAFIGALLSLLLLGGEEQIVHIILVQMGGLIMIKRSCKGSMADGAAKSMSGSYHSAIKILLTFDERRH